MGKDDCNKTFAKLPVKWMAFESLHDGLFSEKTDVVSIIFFIRLISQLHSGHMVCRVEMSLVLVKFPILV